MASLHYHVRIAPPLLEPFKSWVSPYKHVIAREHGTVEGREHYHAWFNPDIGLEAIKKKLQKWCADQGLKTARGKSNSYYGGLKEWGLDYGYIVKEGDVVSFSQITGDELQSAIEEGKARWRAPKASPSETSTGTITPGPDLVPVIKMAKKRQRWDEKIIEAAEVELGWKVNEQFTLEAFLEGSAQKAVEKHITRFMKARFNNNEAVKYARNLLYHFADVDLSEFLEKRYWEKISWC